MPRQSLHETTFPRVKAYLSESDRAVTVKDVAQFLEMSTTAAHDVLQLMEIFKMVQKVKRGKTYYFLKGVYDDEQIEAMLPPRKVAVRERTGEGPSALSIIGLQPKKDEEAEG